MLKRRPNKMRWLALIFFVATLRGEDWPQFLGPRRDGTYREPISTEWPKEGPRRSWEISVGQGFAGPVVSGSKVFLFHRVGQEERLECFDAETGKSIWKNGYAATYRDDFGFDPGPRSTPGVSGGRVFTYGADGVVSAIDVESGKTLWRVDAKEEFGSKKGWFGRACSPLIFGELVLIQVDGVIAFEAATGKARWRADTGDASYSSGALDGKNALFLTRKELVSLDAENGKANWKYSFAPNIDASVTAAVPLIDGDSIFISASYGAGSALIRASDGKEIWKGDSMANHYASCVKRIGLVFGFDGRQEQKASLACIEWKTGKTRWRKEGFGSGTVTLVGDRLLIMLETGELVLAAAGPEGYREFQRAQILGFGVRAYPALADGFFYARSKDKLGRWDIRK